MNKASYSWSWRTKAVILNRDENVSSMTKHKEEGREEWRHQATRIVVPQQQASLKH